MANYILCPECFATQPIREEKCCSHGCGGATCSSCGKNRNVATDPHWHCLGSVREVTTDVQGDPKP